MLRRKKVVLFSWQLVLKFFQASSFNFEQGRQKCAHLEITGIYNTLSCLLKSFIGKSPGQVSPGNLPLYGSCHSPGEPAKPETKTEIVALAPKTTGLTQTHPHPCPSLFV